MGELSASGLAEEQRAAVRAVAERLAGAGARAWVVGGAVRDLARGTTPSDVDMVSAARPEVVEGLFPTAHAVGRAFGIVLVQVRGVAIEVATFRTEGSYTDARHPDAVRWGSSLEEDAARRDFTLNALYLDPLTDELADPTGGLDDLRAGRLRTVGEPGARFREDGLRLLRMGRFLAALELEPAPGLLQAAAGAADALRGVSAERVLEELGQILEGPHSARALAVLEQIGVLERALPGWAEASRMPFEQRLRAWGALPEPPGILLGLAVLLEGDPLGPGVPAADVERARGLRPSRVLIAGLERAWSLRRALQALAGEGVSRSARVLALRDPGWEAAFDLALAWAHVAGRDPAPLEALRAWRAALGPGELAPAPLVGSGDLAALGVPRGPRWGALLAEAERRQLDGELGDRDQARAWLAARVRGMGSGPDCADSADPAERGGSGAQEGGKARRRAKDNG